MNTKIGQFNLKPFVTLNCEDLEFSSEGVSVASCQILMFRHETGSCYISGMLCPIYTKLHTFDKNVNYISLLIIPCIIYHVTNKETLNLES